MSPCPAGTFPYTIQPGDTLWLLAQQYHAGVDKIVTANPEVDPGKLIVGQIICIPIGKGISKAELDLSNLMRMLWEEHIVWTRMAIISIAEELPDQDLVIQRLLRNATDMGALFRTFYGDEKASKFGSLIKDHLVIAAQLVKAAKAGDSKAAADAEKNGMPMQTK